MDPVGDGAVVIERGKHLVNAADDLVQPHDIQEGLLLSGKGGFGEIFRRRRRADGYADIVALTQFIPGRVDLCDERGLQFGLPYRVANAAAAFSQGLDIVDIQRLELLIDRAGKTLLIEKIAERICGGCEAEWHRDTGVGQGLDHLAKRRILAANLGDVLHAAFRQFDHVV